ncbi:hypothetical protein RUM8411_04442 [Ruegeria meonggei]|uniref:Uncharacterized protein n=1 Tax=Ruegeria meonggei TaxID=1446476 RepID=A0A1X7ACU5_9RHOB|nr:hypothetical protein RUM8411_04442 [Ruegeria meonggei]
MEEISMIGLDFPCRPFVRSVPELARAANVGKVGCDCSNLTVGSMSGLGRVRIQCHLA